MRRKQAAIAALAGIAALRVLLLAAAFPFFHQVDEHQHVDTIHRWSRGQLPGAEAAYLSEPVIDWALEFGSFEYLEANPPPPYLARPGARPDSPWVPEVRAAFASVVNQEAESPPTYYAAAALWYKAGELAFEGVDLLLWVRALNALVLAALIVLAHAWLRRRAPDDPLLYWGVPALLAFFPQDAFYGIGPDGFCALMGGLAFVGAVEAASPGPRTVGRDVTAGVAVALAFLAKYTNAIYGGVLVVALALRMGSASGRGEAGTRVAARIALAGGVAAALSGAWLLRNQLVVGDALATARKVAHLEWTPLPWSDFLSHPIFGPAGFSEWAPTTLALFWRGEFRWLAEPMTLPGLDGALALVSAVCLAFGAASAWRAARRGAWLEPLALLTTLAGFATLAMLSARFAFTDWGNPTRAHPYFTEGRLVLGVLLPFSVVFVRGIGQAFSRLHPAVPWAALGLWIALVTATDFAVAAPAFASPWNWFHLP
ncbi:MAG: hypothetical protein JRG83_14130 [Deltaproteobacteria bacterium]|nr:hypothetical protein [Deltaproteobacteria bacterium]